jgi:hypothetical protein
MLKGKDLTDYLDGIERAGMSVTRQWFSVWQDAIRYMWGEQLQGIKKRRDWDYITINYIYPLAMQGVAKLSKNSPKILGRAWNPEHAEWAEHWQGLLQYVCEQVIGIRMEMIGAMIDSTTFGYAVGKPYWVPKAYWDNTRKVWVGDVRHRLLHPCNYWADPAAERVRDCENCGTVRKVGVEWAVRQWPEFEKEIREEVGNPAEAMEGYEFASGTVSYSSGSEPLYSNQRATGTSIRGRIANFVNFILGHDTAVTDAGPNVENQTNQQVWVRETYFQDPCEKHVVIQDPADTDSLVQDGKVYIDPADPNRLVRWSESGEVVAQDEWPQVTRADYYEPQFPRGRVVIRVGTTIVNPDLEQQRYNYSRWPFSVLPYHVLPHMWQGSNAVDMSRGTQDMLNVTMSYLLHHLKMSSCPQKVIEENTLATDKKGNARMKNVAGEMIVVKKGRLGAIQNLPSDRLDPAVWTLVQYLMSDLETQQFMHAVAQGKSSSNMSATEAARLDTNANDDVAMRSFMLERWLENTATVLAEIIQENYDEGRRIKIVGWTGDVKPTEITAEMKEVEWDLEIEPGTTLPFDEERQKNDYLTAYKLCGDPNLNPMLEEVLRKLNIANRDKILLRHQQLQVFKQIVQLAQQTQQAMGQLQQAAQQPGPNGEAANPQIVQAQAAQIQQAVVQRVMAALGQMVQAGQEQPQMQEEA